MILKLLRSLAVTTTAIAALVLSAVPARAEEVHGEIPEGRVSGDLSVVGDTATWNLTVSNTDWAGCVYAAIEIDRTGPFPNPTYESGRACNYNGVTEWPGDITNSYTSGARLLLCVERSVGPQSCKEVAYVAG